ncbi:MAG: hypothetical protein HYU66_00345, partial [Armatimonadetes bacterium]|nr:hypothetical protein [Armatimonadota bacterium]
MSVDPERRSAGGRPADERSEAELRMIGCVDRLCLHVCASLLIGILVGLGVWRETGDWRLFAFSTLLFSGVLAFQRVFFPMPWPPPQPPAPPLYADDAVRRRLAGCEVIGLLAEDDEVYLQTGSRKVPLVELMPDTDPLVTARQVQALLRERGAPDGGEVVDA